MKHLKLNELPLPDVYVPLLQKPVDLFAVVVRTRLDPPRFSSALRRATGAVDPNQPFRNVETVPDLIARSMATEHLQTTLLGSFGAVSLMLAVAGVGAATFLFGSAADTRNRDPSGGGAPPGRVLAWVLGRAMRIATRLHPRPDLAARSRCHPMARASDYFLDRPPSHSSIVFIVFSSATLLQGYLHERRMRAQTGTQRKDYLIRSSAILFLTVLTAHNDSVAE